MLTILENIDSYINDYLDGRIENPLLKKVIIDEIAISNNLIEIIPALSRYGSSTLIIRLFNGAFPFRA